MRKVFFHVSYVVLRSGKSKEAEEYDGYFIHLGAGIKKLRFHLQF